MKKSHSKNSSSLGTGGVGGGEIRRAMRCLDCEALGTAAPSKESFGRQRGVLTPQSEALRTVSPSKGSFGRQGGVLTPQSEALRTVSPSKESFGRQEAVPAPRQHQGV